MPQRSVQTPMEECPACGTAVPFAKAYGYCPACGAPLGLQEDASGDLTPAGRSLIHKQALALNERLMEAGANNAESAFNLSCGMSLTLILISSVLVYFFAGRSWLLVVITAIMAAIAGLWIVTLLSSVARSGAIRYTYKDEVGPEIERFVRDNRLNRHVFDMLALDHLPDRAPLREFLQAEDGQAKAARKDKP